MLEVVSLQPTANFYPLSAPFLPLVLPLTPYHASDTIITKNSKTTVLRHLQKLIITKKYKGKRVMENSNPSSPARQKSLISLRNQGFFIAYKWPFTPYFTP